MLDDAPDAARAPFMLEDTPAARAWRFPRLNLRQAFVLVEGFGGARAVGFKTYRDFAYGLVKG